MKWDVNSNAAIAAAVENGALLIKSLEDVDDDGDDEVLVTKPIF